MAKQTEAKLHPDHAKANAAELAMFEANAAWFEIIKNIADIVLVLQHLPVRESGPSILAFALDWVDHEIVGDVVRDLINFMKGYGFTYWVNLIFHVNPLQACFIWKGIHPTQRIKCRDMASEMGGLVKSYFAWLDESTRKSYEKDRQG